MPSYNVNAEVAIRKIKTIVNKNSINSGATLQELITTINHRPASIPGAASAYTRLTGLKPRLYMPSSSSPPSEEKKVLM